MRTVLQHSPRSVPPAVTLIIWTVLTLAVGVRCGAADTVPVMAEGIEFFETHIRPVLVEKCYECHSAKAKIVQG